MPNYGPKVKDYMVAAKEAELKSIEFGKELGGNDKYYVAPVLGLTVAGEPMAKYGIFNRATGLMEADTRQFHSALGWAEALMEGPPEQGALPGLGA